MSNKKQEKSMYNKSESGDGRNSRYHDAGHLSAYDDEYAYTKQKTRERSREYAGGQQMTQKRQSNYAGERQAAQERSGYSDGLRQTNGYDSEYTGKQRQLQGRRSNYANGRHGTPEYVNDYARGRQKSSGRSTGRTDDPEGQGFNSEDRYFTHHIDDYAYDGPAQRYQVKVPDKGSPSKKGKFIPIIIIIVAIIVAGAVFFGVKGLSGNSAGSEYYLASNGSMVDLYAYDEYGYLVSDNSVKRGLAVDATGNTVTDNGVEYTEVLIDGKKYYVLGQYLVNDVNDVVKETKKYVRTSLTVYEDNDTPVISGFLKKGSELELLGYDELLEDGSVNMYYAKCGDCTGWIYGKYLVETAEEAAAVYNENSEYDTHKDRVFGGSDLGGGSPTELDWYPYEKTIFEDNPIKQNARTMYLTDEACVNVDDYISLALSCGCDAMVVDIKDYNCTYKSDVMLSYCPSSADTSIFSAEEFKAIIQKIKDAGIYVIGRIVTFKDTYFSIDHPEECIESSAASSAWPSGFSRVAWQYAVSLALEAIDLCGFNEIQFDYVRFPEEAYKMSQAEDTDWRNTYDEGKAAAIQNFAFYACDVIHRKHVYVSFDVFGECAYEYVTAYGQYWPAISNVVDAISGMPYTDHFGSTVDTWSNPYETVYEWACKAAVRQTEIPTPAIARTWLTCYNTPNWSPTVIYDEQKMTDQVNALIDAGLPGGFLTWNGKALLDKYTEVKNFWGKDYDWYKVNKNPNYFTQLEAEQEAASELASAAGSADTASDTTADGMADTAADGTDGGAAETAADGAADTTAAGTADTTAAGSTDTTAAGAADG